MRRFHNYTIAPESWESQSAAGRYHPADELTWRHKGQQHTITLANGTTDAVEVYRHHDLLVILATNWGLQYCGIQVFHFKTGVDLGECFIHVDTDILKALGKRGLDLAPHTIATRLLDYALVY